MARGRYYPVPSWKAIPAKASTLSHAPVVPRASTTPVDNSRDDHIPRIRVIHRRCHVGSSSARFLGFLISKPWYSSRNFIAHGDRTEIRWVIVVIRFGPTLRRTARREREYWCAERERERENARYRDVWRCTTQPVNPLFTHAIIFRYVLILDYASSNAFTKFSSFYMFLYLNLSETSDRLKRLSTLHERSCWKV